MSDAEKLLGGLKKQNQKYREMVAVAAEERSVLDSTDMDALLRVLDRKRRLLAEINEIEMEIADAKKRWPEIKSKLDAAMAKEIEAAIDEIRDVLGNLVKLEEQWKTTIEQKKDVTAKELKGMSQKKKARDAYGGTQKGPPGTRFYDDKK